MKLEELNKQIKSGALKSLYFFYGEEQYLLKNKINAIEKKLIVGDERGNLLLHSYLTREQFCVLLKRYHDIMKQ